jgi:amidase
VPAQTFRRSLPHDGTAVVPSDIACAINDVFDAHGSMPMTSDIGDCLFTAMEIENTELAAPGYYAGMGFGVPAGFGVAASTGKRPLILVGDGAFQMTGFELGNCRRYGLDPIVVLFNNASWEMLRAFQPESKFNDLSDWHFADMAAPLGGHGVHARRAGAGARRSGGTPRHVLAHRSHAAARGNLRYAGAVRARLYRIARLAGEVNGRGGRSAALMAGCARGRVAAARRCGRSRRTQAQSRSGELIMKLGSLLLAACAIMTAQAGNIAQAQTPAFPVVEASIADIEAAYLTGRTTARAVTQAHLDRIAAFDKRGPLINSLITVNPRALADADRLDAALALTGRPVGPLHGIPVVIKDNIDVAGLPMTAGFQGWKNYYPPEDAPLVKKIRAAGGIILAKASLSEFARGLADNINSVLAGFARNPYNTAFATGGSSGGTGAALAASFAVAGIGTDTGGSVRAPSAHNALAGLRPTVGLVSRTGMTPLNSVRDTPGPMARSVADMAILLDVIVGPDPVDPATARAEGHRQPTYTALRADALKGARLGVLRQVFGPAVTDPRIIAQFEETIAELKAAGAEIVDPFIVPVLDQRPRTPQTAARFKDDMNAWFTRRPGVPFASMRGIADSKLAHPLHQAGLEEAAAAKPVDEDPETIEGLKNEERYRDGFTADLEAGRIDAVIFPTWAQLPVVNGDRNTQLAADPKPGAGPTAFGSGLTLVASSLQWPAISVPRGFLGEGLPQGLQILGRPWEEAKIIGYAFAYEQATHHRRPPPLPAL